MMKEIYQQDVCPLAPIGHLGFVQSAVGCLFRPGLVVSEGRQGQIEILRLETFSKGVWCCFRIGEGHHKMLREASACWRLTAFHASVFQLRVPRCG
jgi:hypothetical protein